MKSLLASNFRHVLLILASCLMLSGCASAPPQASLYERLGGLPALTAVADRTLDRAVVDPRTKRPFEGVKLKPLKESIVAHLCHITGGPCKYDGPTIDKAHKGLAITSAEFDAMDQILGETLDQFKVGAREKSELQQILGALKHKVVAK